LKNVFSGNGLALEADKIAVPSFKFAPVTRERFFSARTHFVSNHRLSLMVKMGSGCHILELGGSRQPDGSLGAPLKTYYADSASCNWETPKECKKKVAACSG
jgi:hypothetical protein